jgi:hypothetical protein
LTKTTVYFVSAITGLVVLGRAWLDRLSWHEAGRQIAGFALPALTLGLIWWIHGVDVYGGTDFLGLQRHDEVVVGQLRRVDYIEKELGGDEALYWENLRKTTFHSFWGQFGWMAVPMPPRIYRYIQIVLGILALGLGLRLLLMRFWKNLHPEHWLMMSLLALMILLVALQFYLYNRTFVQFQGRYLYPALLPLALLIGLAVESWAWPIAHLLKRPLVFWLCPMLVLPLAYLAWFALNAWLVPNLQ